MCNFEPLKPGTKIQVTNRWWRNAKGAIVMYSLTHDDYLIKLFNGDETIFDEREFEVIDE